MRERSPALRGRERGTSCGVDFERGPWEDREREEVHAFAAAMYGTAQHRLDRMAKRADVGRLASALVHSEIGVLSSNDQFPRTCSQVGPILSALCLSRSWEEGLWHAS